MLFARTCALGRNVKDQVKRKSCKKNSFVPGTKVLMADGSTKNIEGLKEGEYVLASDPETGNLQARQVTDTITGDGVKHLVTLTVDPDGKDGKAKPSKIWPRAWKRTRSPRDQWSWPTG
ncbi:hypothetical protein [Streptomyces sp. UG1]|uniref:hypothetical protein n=1 Tax=Streptomyces sp. UG1 TaxID=3417652 RepID=UPI003CEAA23E